MVVKIRAEGLENGEIVDVIANGEQIEVSKQGRTIEKLNIPTELKDSFKILPTKIGRIVEKDKEKFLSIVEFVHLHLHTEFSLLDGANRIKALTQRLNPLENPDMSGISAITDHGNMFGTYQFSNAMVENNCKPIIGCEVYCESIEGSKDANHLVLLCKDETGYHNLCHLITEAEENLYRRPQVTWDNLRKYHKGLVCLSACLAGEVARTIAKDYYKAIEVVENFMDIFGEDFYIEIQNHHIADELRILPELVKLADEMGVKYVCTTDAHYLNKEDAKAHEVLLCIGTGKTMNEEHFKFDGDGYHVLNNQEGLELFKNYPQSIYNQYEIVKKCNFKFSKVPVTMPDFEVPEGYNVSTYFEKLCWDGFIDRYQGKDIDEKAYRERLQYEIDVIKKMNFEGYFLVVQDFINWAKNNGIAIGPGRGSAAGAMVAYVLKITDLDPIPFGLLFERFLNPERVSMPDIDVDIEDARRPEVIEYVRKKYGEDHVSRIVTFGTMAARMVVRDVGRVLQGNPIDIDNTAKAIPAEPKMTIAKALNVSPELKDIYDNNEHMREILDLSMKLEGISRHKSQHACFDRETLITTEKGLVPIKDVAVGTKVLTHKGNWERVVRTSVTEAKEIYTVKTDATVPVKVTGNHPFYVRSIIKSEPIVLSEPYWKPVEDIDVDNDYIGIVSENFFKGEYTWARISEITKEQKEQLVYNLTVENDSSYVAANIAVHNCGMVVAKDPIVNNIPEVLLADKAGNPTYTAAFNMVEIEELGLLKIDFLGLRNMGIIKYCTDKIGITNEDIDMYDPKVYEYIGTGDTDGIFQIESPGMKGLMQEMFADVSSKIKLCSNNEDVKALGFECFQRLIAAIALYRPGPMDFIPEYVQGMRNPEAVHYDHPMLEPILGNTYGVCVYQEQVQQICRDLAGFSLGRADLIRRAMGKKKQSIMDAEKKVFIYGNADAVASGKETEVVPGCIANGISEAVANTIWDKMEKFAQYAFNKSHSAGYAVISVWTAWLKYYHQKTFWTATLNSFISNMDKLKQYISCAKLNHIDILPPSVNKSSVVYSEEEDGIRMGLQGIKNLGKASFPIVEERLNNGEYEDFADFIKRLLPDKKMLEALIAAGALDEFDGTRKGKRLCVEDCLEYKAKLTKYTAWNNVPEITEWYKSIVTMPEIIDVPEMEKNAMLKQEYEYTGMYITEHPLDQFGMLLASFKHEELKSLLDDDDENEEVIIRDNKEESVVVVGIIKELKSIITKKGKQMFALQLEDKTGRMKCTLFPDKAKVFKDEMFEDNIIKVEGKLKTDDFGTQIIVDSVVNLSRMVVSRQTVLNVLTNDMKHLRTLKDTLIEARSDEQDALTVRVFFPNDDGKIVAHAVLINGKPLRVKINFETFLKIKELSRNVSIR